jgi:quercetin dioxygenase-like cupin family protein
MSGRFEFHCGAKVEILEAGDAFYVEADTPHEAYCLEPGIIIDGFSPIREDFLK